MKKMWFLLLAVLGVVVACNLPTMSPQKAWSTPIPAGSPVSPPAATLTPTPAGTATSSAAPHAQDCGQDADCLIQAARACQPASGDFVTTMDLLGARGTITTHFEIHGRDASGACAFDVQTTDAKVTYSDELVQQLKQSGLSDEQIEAQQRQAEEAQKTSGPSGACTGKGEDLAAMLSQWQHGNFTLDDWAPFTCTSGTLANRGGEIVVTVEVTVEAPSETPAAPAMPAPIPTSEKALAVPTPVVRFDQVSDSAIQGTKLYWFELVNWQSFPPELFTMHKDIPPCGQRPNRLWVIFRRADTMEEIGRGCGDRSSEELRNLELPLREDQNIPHTVVVDLWDRLTDQHYLSAPVTFP